MNPAMADRGYVAFFINSGVEFKSVLLISVFHWIDQIV